ncbi:MAG: PqqD family protein [Planctomycetes bacterium]|nr:PqqD family protein [Planctomycetota bacterium]
MQSGPQFCPHPHVVHQTVDGEAILIQMDSGVYFSLRGASCSAWSILSGTCSAAELAAGLRRACTGCPSAGLEHEAAEFIEALKKENLLVESSGPGSEVEPVPSAYAPLQFEKFTDMQDLLLADPIHEVSEAGWPVLPPGVKP